MKDSAQLSDLLKEASDRFIGRGEIIGIAFGGEEADLTVFLAQPDVPQKKDVRSWAKDRGVSVAFVESGSFKVS
jgi:hypothetical protein